MELCRSCIRLCHVVIEELKFGSALQTRACALCAVICRACADECRTLAGPAWAACARACFRAAEECREIALLAQATAQEQGYLPNAKVTSLTMATGNVNPQTGRATFSGANGVNDPSLLLATTFGRGAYAIRLSPLVIPNTYSAPANGDPQNRSPLVGSPSAKSMICCANCSVSGTYANGNDIGTTSLEAESMGAATSFAVD